MICIYLTENLIFPSMNYRRSPKGILCYCLTNKNEMDYYLKSKNEMDYCIKRER